jgi:glucose-6-phosphate isomerase
VFTHIAVERDEPVFYAGTARPRPVGTALPLPPHEPVDSLVRDDRGRPAGYDGLGGLAGRGFDALNRAAREGAASALRDADRPVLELILPDASEYHVGGLMQMLMIATVLEAKLLGVNPYGRNGAEPFTRNMMQRLRG